MGYYGGRVPQHDHSDENSGGALPASLVLAAVAITAALAGTTGYFSGSLGAANVTASSMTVSGEISVATIRFSDNSTLTTAPGGAGVDFGPSTAALSASTQAAAATIAALGSSTNTFRVWQGSASAQLTDL